ncbi:amino acid adenylation domain-containing protein [Pedobacter sp. AW31-3R]|uniref:amino acid adenylation domain-containing protein n=1 Tax=Pedobacter sp. AW31-3R TaxID=3445781 RepID=UPI003FA00163
MKDLLKELSRNGITLSLNDDYDLKVQFDDLEPSSALIQQLREKKQEIVSYLKAQANTNITPAAPEMHYILSSSQRRLWLLSQFDEGNVAYNMPGVYVFEGELDEVALKRSFLTLIERHEILRTSFKEAESGEVRQYIHPAEPNGFEFVQEDLRAIPDRETLAHAMVQGVFLRPFDLEAGFLLRAGLYRLEDHKWVFSYTMHHIISDGWSMGILITELLGLYNAYIKGGGNPYEPLRIQYKDYAVWQQAELSGDALEAHKNYWLNQFSGKLPVLELPSNKIRPAVKTYNGGVVTNHLSATLTEGLKRLCQEQECTLFMGLLAVVNTLLYHYSGQEDIVIGSPIAGREHLDLEGQIGFYVNTLALRFRFDGNGSFRDLLQMVSEVTFDAYEHQVYPFDELVDELEVPRDMSRSVLFDVMVTLHNISTPNKGHKQSLGELQISGYQAAQNPTSKFDLSFDFVEAADGMNIAVEYNSDIFSAFWVDRLSGHLQQLIAAVIAAADQPLASLDYLSDAERVQLLETFNSTTVAYPYHETFVSLFEAQVAQYGTRIAVVFEDKALTYNVFNADGNRLCVYLQQSHGIKPGDLVGICLERSEKFIISVLAILKAGAAYVPVDPQYPQERIDYIKQDSNSKVMIDEAFLAAYAAFDGPTEVSNPILQAGPDDLAYVIYTSGSTGQPKGVMIEHRGMLNHMYAMVSEMGLDQDSRIAQNASITFDISVWQLLNALILGGTTVVYRHETVLDVPLFISRVVADGIRILQVVPSYLKAMMDIMDEAGTYDLSALEYLLVTGETIGQPLLQRWFERFPDKKVVNAYGPAEASDDVTLYIMDKAPEGTNVPVGKPIQNMKIYILNKLGKLCPVGVMGEIHVSGVGVGRAYINKPEKSAASFGQDPFQPGNIRMYRTGDHGRWLEDGNIEFAGRKDDQVKVRGYRIELGEIESVLQTHPDLQSVVVIAPANKTGERKLVAYVTGTPGLDLASIKTYLLGVIPAYMVPSHFMQLDQLPLTPNGKVDKKALPDVAAVEMISNTAYQVPENETQAQLVAIWSEVLGLNQIGINDDFFDLGGHSLKATRLTSQIHKVFNVKIGLKELFATPVLAAQALLIAQSKTNIFEALSIAPLRDSYVLSSSQRRLWILSQFEEGSQAYNMPGVYFFEGELDEGALEWSFFNLIARHEILRTTFREDEELTVRQYIHQPSESRFILKKSDLRAAALSDEEIHQLVREELLQAFDLAAGPLLRASLYQLEDQKWIFSYTMHHIISDGWSMGVLITELLNLYNSRIRNAEMTYNPLKIQYKDYAVWQQAQLSGESLALHKDYWLQQFSGSLPVLELPQDKLRPVQKTYDGAVLNRRLPATLNEAFKKLGQDQGCTLFMSLLAVVNTLLYRYSGQEDIIVGTPIAGREHLDLEEQIGFYVNTLAIRSRFDGTGSFLDLLRKVREVTLGAYEHQVYPFDELVDELNLHRDMSRNSLFDVLIVLENAEMVRKEGQKTLDKLQIREYFDHQVIKSKFDLSFDFVESAEALDLTIEYNTSIYGRDLIEGMINHLEQLIKAVVAQPFLPLCELEYLSPAESVQLLETFNATKVPYETAQTVLHQFRNQVGKTPDKNALVYGDEQFSYLALDVFSNQFAHYLNTVHGVQKEDLVGVTLVRSHWMVAAVLGILKAGGAYVAIDPEYPEERKAYLIKDSNCKVVLDDALIAGFISESAQYPDTALPLLQESSDLAYVIYTSGSTGNPKGVMIEHGSLFPRIKYYQDTYGLTEADNMMFYRSYSFDASIEEYLLPILTGATCYVAPEDFRLNLLSNIISFIEKHQISKLDMTPALLTEFVYELVDNKEAASRINSVRHVVSGGDKLPLKVVQLYFSVCQAALYNTYGPTENTIDSTNLKMTAMPSAARISIGKPIQNSEAYILDKQQQLVPVYVYGELCVAGPGLARGYLNKPELTAEKFIDNPYRPGELMYLTGDYCRWLPDGQIEFLGRKDDQVKIMGHRIELVEIESSLEKHPMINSAVVVARTHPESEPEIIAYFIAQQAQLDQLELRNYLMGILPLHFLPKYFVQLEEMPQNANGKVDKKLLPEPEHQLDAAELYVEPQTETQQKLMEIWEQVLDTKRIGIQSSFFSLGGNSIQVIRLQRLINQEFNTDLTIATFFEMVTIEMLSNEIEKKMGLTSAHSKKDIDVLNF